MDADSNFDVAIVGAGPAGSSCAAFCAAAGLRTLLIDRAKFPRDKVCGDCINPSSWPILGRLGIDKAVRRLPHEQLETVEFIDLKGRSIVRPLPQGPGGEIAVKRLHFDALLLENAAAAGAKIHTGDTAEAVSRVERGWSIKTQSARYPARVLVAADGRNSTIARLLGLLPPAGRDRIACQTHTRAPAGFRRRVALRLRPEGYCGFATVGETEINLCLVSTSIKLPALKEWACGEFNLPSDQPWQTIAPLARRPVLPGDSGFLAIGDAARVVEPFTGEGIYYALASGECAARFIIESRKSGRPADLAGYRPAHKRLYHDRLWVNRIARFAVENPRAGHALLGLLSRCPSLLSLLTGKIVKAPTI